MAANYGGMAKAMIGMLSNGFAASAKIEAEKENYAALALEAADAEYQAVDAGQRGAVLAGLARMQGSKLAAKQRVAYSGGGVDASVGTAADTIAETAMFSELDSATIANNAAREAWGHKQSARQARVKQKQSDARASAAVTEGVLSSIGSIFEFAGAGGG